MSPAAVSCSLLSPTSSAATQLHHTAARTRETGDYDSFSPREQNTTPPFLSCKWLKKVVGFQKETWKWALPIQQKPKISQMFYYYLTDTDSENSSLHNYYKLFCCVWKILLCKYVVKHKSAKLQESYRQFSSSQLSRNSIFCKISFSYVMQHKCQK